MKKTFALQPMEEMISNYSSFAYLCIIIAWMIRFINNCRGAADRTSFVSISECEEASKKVLRYIQGRTFSKELNALRNGKKLPTGRKLLSLCPFIDEEGILRVGGRFENSTLPYAQKHPIILPALGHCVGAIIRDAHIHMLHGRKATTLSLIRKKYWNINGLRTVKSVQQNCVRCKRFTSNLQQQLMGQLPKPRLNFTKPFLHTGVDFAGPIQVMSKPGRGVRSYKGYIAVFVCLAVKAIHLEFVSSLTADAFIAALKRFVSRRGVEKMCSDNVINFVGEFRKLKHFQNLLREEKIEWNFIPPASSHFGGLWEAGVKSMKTHLRRVLAICTMTVEEMITVLAQIESCLNSRPICPMTDDAEDLDVLTPNHFLTGQQLIPIAEQDLSRSQENRLTRWQLCTLKHQEVCQRYIFK